MILRALRRCAQDDKMTHSINDLLDVTAEKLVAGGEALCRVDGFPIFVTSLFPGDRARVRIVEAKKGFARALIEELLEPGPERRDEPCPIAGICGGCDWTALRLDRQLHWKREILRETLRRVGKLDPMSLPHIRLHPSPLNYRLRSRIHVDQKSGEVGFYAMRSHDVIEISDRCEIIGPLAKKHLDDIRALGREGHWAIAMFEDGHDLHLEPIDDDAGRQGEELSLLVGKRRFRLSSAGFFQVNHHLLGTLLDRVAAIAAECRDRSTALDLYGGVGFFAVPLTGHFSRVTSVESSPVAHHYAKLNLPREEATAVLGDVERYVRAQLDPVAFVMLDPPRSGATPAVIDAVARIATERICYLSCDPVTFARDASRLLSRGWHLSTLELVDLFPNTHHIETLSSFIRER
jgi:23S rRNA (uracil1939-C5)-methyltransferase